MTVHEEFKNKNEDRNTQICNLFTDLGQWMWVWLVIKALIRRWCSSSPLHLYFLLYSWLIAIRWDERQSDLWQAANDKWKVSISEISWGIGEWETVHRKVGAYLFLNYLNEFMYNICRHTRRNWTGPCQAFVVKWFYYTKRRDVMWIGRLGFIFICIAKQALRCLQWHKCFILMCCSSWQQHCSRASLLGIFTWRQAWC